MNTTEFDKLKLTIRAQLLGMAQIDESYLTCVRALDYASEIHTGFRKDGVTPEFYHQLSLVGFALTQIRNMRFAPTQAQAPNMTHAATIIGTLLLHDTYEDNQHLEDEIRQKFAELIEYVIRSSKIRRGVKLNTQEYIDEVALCIICSIVKLIDRLHNLSTMLGVFSEAKLREYVEETEKYYFPMLKKAKRLFPEQNALYELMKSVLHLQLNAIKFHIAQLDAAKKAEVA
jgi:(p)ppGpp synthase/HD superfamily hydrolase